MRLVNLNLPTAGNCDCCAKWVDIPCCPYIKCGISQCLRADINDGDMAVLDSSAGNNSWKGYTWLRGEIFKHPASITLSCVGDQWMLEVVVLDGICDVVASAFATLSVCPDSGLFQIDFDLSIEVPEGLETVVIDLSIQITDPNTCFCCCCHFGNEVSLGVVTFGDAECYDCELFETGAPTVLDNENDACVVGSPGTCLYFESIAGVPACSPFGLDTQSSNLLWYLNFEIGSRPRKCKAVLELHINHVSGAGPQITELAGRWEGEILRCGEDQSEPKIVTLVESFDRCVLPLEITLTTSS